ncbi:hypothetical protein [Streptomyces platensis]|uniref:hypothetical protein n=1 Tax=Streptomyces platensis TaxID=58346 RepID=UPI00386BF00D|nr:hypothetical protein OG962_36590 [Streptomyces platensis]
MPAPRDADGATPSNWRTKPAQGPACRRGSSAASPLVMLVLWLSGSAAQVSSMPRRRFSTRWPGSLV